MEEGSSLRTSKTSRNILWSLKLFNSLRTYRLWENLLWNWLKRLLFCLEVRRRSSAAKVLIYVCSSRALSVNKAIIELLASALILISTSYPLIFKSSFTGILSISGSARIVTRSWEALRISRLGCFKNSLLLPSWRSVLCWGRCLHGKNVTDSGRVVLVSSSNL